MASAATTPRDTRLAEQRRSLPDGPGVYLFRDEQGTVIYVGKAKSIRKRVAGHFSNVKGAGATRGAIEMVSRIHQIEFLLVASEAEALLTENTFIKEYKPRFNVRLRDDKSYPFLAISLDEEYPRVYFTRERHRKDRAVLRPVLERQEGPRHARPAAEGLRVPLVPGPRARPPQRLAVPGLLHQALRRALRRLPVQGGVPRGDRRRHRLPLRPLPPDRARPRAADEGGRRRRGVRAGRAGAQPPAAVKSLLERQRVANEAVGTLDAIAIAVDGVDANAQVFQVRDGVLSDRQSFYLSNETGRSDRRGRRRVHPAVLRRDAGDPGAGHRPARRRGHRARSARRSRCAAARRVEVRAAERGDKRRILELAERNAQLALDQERLKDERRRQQRVEALDGLQRVLGLDALPLRIECFDISNLMGTNTVASMVVFEARRAEEVRLPALQHPLDERARPTTSLAMEEVLDAAARPLGVRAGPQPQRPEAQRVLRDAAEPHRHRRRQGPAVRRHAGAAGRSSTGAWRSSASPSGSRRSSSRAATSRSCWRTTRPRCSCCSACATRPTASRSRTTASAATAR